MLEGYLLYRSMSDSGGVNTVQWTHQAFLDRRNSLQQIVPLGMEILHGDSGQQGGIWPGSETDHRKRHLRQSLGRMWGRNLRSRSCGSRVKPGGYENKSLGMEQGTLMKGNYGSRRFQSL